MPALRIGCMGVGVDGCMASVLANVLGYSY